MFENVGRQFFEWGKLICKIGIVLSFTAKNGHGHEKIALYHLFISFLNQFTSCLHVVEAFANKEKVPRNITSVGRS